MVGGPTVEGRPKVTVGTHSQKEAGGQGGSQLVEDPRSEGTHRAPSPGLNNRGTESEWLSTRHFTRGLPGEAASWRPSLEVLGAAGPVHRRAIEVTIWLRLAFWALGVWLRAAQHDTCVSQCAPSVWPSTLDKHWPTATGKTAMKPNLVRGKSNRLLVKITSLNFLSVLGPERGSDTFIAQDASLERTLSNLQGFPEPAPGAPSGTGRTGGSPQSPRGLGAAGGQGPRRPVLPTGWALGQVTQPLCAKWRPCPELRGFCGDK